MGIALTALSLSCSPNRPHRPPRQVPPPLSKLKKLQSQLDFDQLAKNELELKANLYFHIGNPLKRWRVERVVPIKLILQVLKTVCLIVQVCGVSCGYVGMWVWVWVWGVGGRGS